MPSPDTPQENELPEANQIGEEPREKVESNLADQLSSTLEDYAKIQFNRARGGLRTLKSNIEALDPHLPEDELDSKIQQFIEQFSEVLVFLTNQCLELSLTDTKVVEYFKTLVKEIISHPNFDLIEKSMYYQICIQHTFLRFIKKV